MDDQIPKPSFLYLNIAFFTLIWLEGSVVLFHHRKWSERRLKDCMFLLLSALTPLCVLVLSICGLLGVDKVLGLMLYFQDLNTFAIRRRELCELEYRQTQDWLSLTNHRPLKSEIWISVALADICLALGLIFHCVGYETSRPTLTIIGFCLLRGSGAMGWVVMAIGWNRTPAEISASYGRSSVVFTTLSLIAAIAGFLAFLGGLVALGIRTMTFLTVALNNVEVCSYTIAHLLTISWYKIRWQRCS